MNQSPAAAQTASIGNQDMMTFLPDKAEYSSRSCETKNRLANNSIENNKNNSKSSENGGNIDHSLIHRGDFHQADAMHNEVFGATLDSLLTSSHAKIDNKVNHADYSTEEYWLSRNQSDGDHAKLIGNKKFSHTISMSEFRDLTEGNTSSHTQQQQLPRQSLMNQSPLNVLDSMPSCISTVMGRSTSTSRLSSTCSAPLQALSKTQSGDSTGSTLRRASASDSLQNDARCLASAHPPTPQSSLEYSARGIVQLPASMIAISQPISMSVDPKVSSIIPPLSLEMGDLHFTPHTDGNDSPRQNQPNIPPNIAQNHRLNSFSGKMTTDNESLSTLCRRQRQQQVQQPLSFLTLSNLALQTPCAKKGINHSVSQMTVPSTDFHATPSSNPQIITHSGLMSSLDRSNNPISSDMNTSSSMGCKTATSNDSKSHSSPLLSAMTIAKSNSKRKRPPTSGSTLLISEDESDKHKRRSERNLREQERSHRITNCISELSELLTEAGMNLKSDRYSTLVGVINYINALQMRSKSLDEELAKLMSAAAKSGQSVNQGENEKVNDNDLVTLRGTSVVQTHSDCLDESISRFSNESNDGKKDDRLFSDQVIDYKQIFSSCGVALAIVSVDGHFVDCNEEFLRITEYTRQKLLESDISNPSVSQNACAEITESSSDVVCTPLVTSSTASDAHILGEDPVQDQCLSSFALTSGVHTHKSDLSLFNLLGREDMETIYAVMSQMLHTTLPACSAYLPACDVSNDSIQMSKSTSSTTSENVQESSSSLTMGMRVSEDCDTPVRCKFDHWSGKVQHIKRKEQMLQLNISLVRAANGKPKFFNCSLAEID